MTTHVSTRLSNPGFHRYCNVSALVMYLSILVVGSIPGERASIGELATGAQLHSTAYAVLACLCYLGRAGGWIVRSSRAVLAVALMGACDEFVQSFFPYRHADVRDWVVDCLAALVTSALMSLALRQLAESPCPGRVDSP